jgi:hypothetical protein
MIGEARYILKRIALIDMEIDIGRLTMERGRPDVSLWHFCCAESTTARPCSSPALLSLEPILIGKGGRPDVSQWGFLLAESGLPRMDSMRTCP